MLYIWKRWSFSPTLDFTIASAESLLAVADHSAVRLLGTALFVVAARAATALAVRSRGAIAVETWSAFLHTQTKHSF